MAKKDTWFKFVIVGTELAFCILAGIFIGSEIDQYFNKTPLFTIIGVILGSIAGFSLMIKIVKNKNNNVK